MFKKILVPLDGSDLAAKILPKVEELAKLCDAEVNLVSVGASEAPMWRGCGQPGESLKRPPIRTNALVCQIFMRGPPKAIAGKGLTVNSACLEGDPGQGDHQICPGQQFDLIALATHGKGSGLGVGQHCGKNIEPRHGAGIIDAGDWNLQASRC